MFAAIGFFDKSLLGFIKLISVADAGADGSSAIFASFLLMLTRAGYSDNTILLNSLLINAGAHFGRYFSTIAIGCSPFLSADALGFLTNTCLHNSTPFA